MSSVTSVIPVYIANSTCGKYVGEKLCSSKGTSFVQPKWKCLLTIDILPWKHVVVYCDVVKIFPGGTFILGFFLGTVVTWVFHYSSELIQNESAVRHLALTWMSRKTAYFLLIDTCCFKNKAKKCGQVFDCLWQCSRVLFVIPSFPCDVNPY